MRFVDAPALPWMDLSGRIPGVKAMPYIAIVVLGTVAFFPGLGAGFVSDDYSHLGWIMQTSFTGVLHHFVPVATTWYRPLNDVVFWLEYQAFGLHPMAYHVVSLACHLAIAALLYRLALRLGARPEAAFAGVASFLLSIHAHELVFWWAAAHYAFGGLAIVAAVLAYVEGWTWLSLVFTVLALLSDEAGIVLLPALAVSEVLFGQPAPGVGRRVLRLVPTAAAVAGYVGLRLAGGGFYGESHPCRTVDCDALGAVQYFDRLLARPGRVIEFLRPDTYLTPNDVIMAAALAALLVAMVVALRAWRWRDLRLVGFGLAWCAISAAVFIYGLWPYASDRFLYYPEMGLALALAGALQQVVWAWPKASAQHRLAIGAFLAGYLAWLAVGIPTIWHRAGQWNQAGRAVATIFDRTVQLEPNPPSGTVLVFQDVPDSLPPDIPPGNTGPYVLRNGLTEGLRIRYGRSDITPVVATSRRPHARSVVCFEILDTNVVQAECPG